MGANAAKTFEGYTEKELRKIMEGYSTKAEFYQSNPEVFCIVFWYCPLILKEVYGEEPPITKCTALERLAALKKDVERQITESDDETKRFICNLVLTGDFPKKFMDIVESDNIMEAISALEAEIVESIDEDNVIIDEYFGY